MTKLGAPRCALLGVASVLAGATLSLLVVALAVRGEYKVGPGTVMIRVQPDLSGSTVVSIPPFGAIEGKTHKAPLRVELSPVSIDTSAATRLVEERPKRSAVVSALRKDLESGLRRFAMRLTIAGLIAGAAATALLRPRSIVLAGLPVLGGVIAPVVLYAATFSGYDVDAFREPTLTGPLSRSPELLGPVRQFGERFNVLRDELDEIGSLTFQLYQFVTRQPVVPDDAIRLLHISDLHLNPLGFDVAEQVARRFGVAAVIDSGDITAEGTVPETRFVERIRDFSVPYMFVRGNHDSQATQNAVAVQPGARVLDGNSTDIAGLSIWGIGDPLFTPDKTVEQPTNDEQREAKLRFSEFVLDQIQLLETKPDIVVVHDPVSASRLPGHVPLVLFGHGHRWQRQARAGTLMLGVGSTGGAGLRSLAPDSGAPIALQVLYFDRHDKRLLAYDRIEVLGPGEEFLLKRITLGEPPGEAGEVPPIEKGPKSTPPPEPSPPSQGLQAPEPSPAPQGPQAPVSPAPDA
ncbi:MAG: metallophosphoesterase [Actinomycetota bacterium]|nr:metallophosphoesterase [Actinomycetota bacterium]